MVNFAQQKLVSKLQLNMFIQIIRLCLDRLEATP